jgi:ParB-like chromosome segregation protein Spo0J
MRIEKRKISELIKAEYNPRKISVVQIQELKDGIEEFGLVEPLVVNENPERKNIIVGGHQRLKIWENLGNTEVDCSIVNLPLDKERKLNIKLNKNGGTFDDDLLKEFFEFEELIEWGFTASELFNNEKEEKEEKEEEYFYDNKWFLNIEFDSEKEIQIWYKKLKKENLNLKIVQ